MTSPTDRPAQIIGIVPQLLVEDLERAVAWYRDRLGFTHEFTYDGFYAAVSRDGYAIHLKHGSTPPDVRAARKAQEHLDAYVAVSGIHGLFSELQLRGATVIRPLGERPWACLDFNVEDPDGHVLCFSQPID